VQRKSAKVQRSVGHPESQQQRIGSSYTPRNATKVQVSAMPVHGFRQKLQSSSFTSFRVQVLRVSGQSHVTGTCQSAAQAAKVAQSSTKSACFRTIARFLLSRDLLWGAAQAARIFTALFNLAGILLVARLNLGNLLWCESWPESRIAPRIACRNRETRKT
jgi:hypothetical protein